MNSDLAKIIGTESVIIYALGNIVVIIASI